MITVANFRHGIKDGDLITRSCLFEIRANGIPALNELIPRAKRVVIHLGTGWYRTRQTVEAYAYYLRESGHGDKLAPFRIRSSPKLGSKKMFSEMTADAELAKTAEKKGWTYAISNSQNQKWQRTRERMSMAMNSILTYLEDDDLCITIGHNGIIETFGHMLSPEIISDNLNLKELEGIIFEADATKKEYDPTCTWWWERAEKEE